MSSSCRVSEPTKAAALCVFSAEFAHAIGNQAIITRQLTSATAAEVDAILVGLLTAGAPAASTDVGTLLSALSGGNPARPALLASYTNLLAQPESVRAARDLGVSVVATSVVGDALLALDLAGVLVGASAVQVASARDATLALSNDGAGTPNFSLWQRDMIGLRAARFVQIVFCNDAVAYASTGSPA